MLRNVRWLWWITPFSTYVNLYMPYSLCLDKFAMVWVLVEKLVRQGSCIPLATFGEKNVHTCLFTTCLATATCKNLLLLCFTFHSLLQVAIHSKSCAVRQVGFKLEKLVHWSSPYKWDNFPYILTLTFIYRSLKLCSLTP